jgi:hypothetical protein
MKLLVGSAGLCLVVIAVAAAQEAPDPFTGTWKLNVARSTMVSPNTASKSETVTYRHVNGEEIYVSDAITAHGEAEHTEYRGVYDGPFGHIKMTIGGKVVTDAPLQLRKLDRRTRLRIQMRPDGLIGGIIVRRLSEDGNTITSSILRFEPDGKVVTHETRVFERQ